jgi:aldehyde dehydrogenase (NAD+)
MREYLSSTSTASGSIRRAKPFDVINPGHGGGLRAHLPRVRSRRRPRRRRRQGGLRQDLRLQQREERLALLERCIEVYQARYQDMADAIREEMGAPKGSRSGPGALGLGHLQEALDVLRTSNSRKTSARTAWSRSRSVSAA